jgi:hypothetical protein
MNKATENWQNKPSNLKVSSKYIITDRILAVQINQFLLKMHVPEKPVIGLLP